MRRAPAALIALLLAAPVAAGARPAPRPAPGSGHAQAGRREAEPALSAPALFDMRFARELSAYARTRKLTIKTLLAILPGGSHAALTDADHYAWTADRGECRSSMSANVPYAEPRLSLAIVTPEDVTVELDQDGAMRCEPVSCEDDRNRELSGYLPGPHPACR